MQADAHLAQRVGGQTDIRKVTAVNLIDEAAAGGIRPRAGVDNRGRDPGPGAGRHPRDTRRCPGSSPSSASKPSGSGRG